MMEWIRWRIAKQLGKLPWTCWASLVHWALGDDDTSIKTCFDDSYECKDFDNSETGRCYCGKFERPEEPTR